MLTRLLTLLLLLLCPLLMLACMWTMRNRQPPQPQARHATRTCQQRSGSPNSNASSPSSASTIPRRVRQGVRLGRAG
jgi:hypothetical protein